MKQQWYCCTYNIVMMINKDLFLCVIVAKKLFGAQISHLLGCITSKWWKLLACQRNPLLPPRLKLQKNSIRGFI
jgi:hypothetical protein